MTLQQALFWFFTAASGAAIFCFVLLAQWYWRRERVERARLRKARLELAELSILFQSIREVIAENKRLAADFSREVEARVDIVKDILQQSVARTRDLYERQRKLAERIVSLEHKLGELEQAAQRQASSPRPDNAFKPRPAGRSEAEKPSGETASVSPTRVIRPAETVTGTVPSGPREDLAGTGVVSGKPVEPWQPVDLSGAARDGESSACAMDRGRAFVHLEPADTSGVPAGGPVTREGAPEIREEKETVVPSEPSPPEGIDPEGWHRVRQAFQELLDLAPEEDHPPDVSLETAPIQAPEQGASMNPDAGDGDQRAFETLKRRVAAYRAAGMSEEAIARELGIGRGEVRLMLSLARLPRGE
ncbi:MAG TPA: hypothetical protein PLH06_09070 [Candidatus Hydrogenedentes bacterium]|nr:hypothetical protein [Candidatus Hydrogenedentota bacterium]